MRIQRLLRWCLALAAVAVLTAAFVLGAGCGGDDTGAGDGGVTHDASPVGEFGDPCLVDGDCASDVCHEFGQLGPTCTLECNDPADCPVGSEGQKCNLQGVCRP